MRTLALALAALAGLSGCVYDPYYRYTYYPPDPGVAVVVTDTDYWPYRQDGYYYRYPYGGYWHRGRYPYYRPYPYRDYWRH
jgi:hypothetical protein